GASIQAKQVGVIRLHIDTIAPDGHTAIDVPGGIIYQSFGDRMAMMPDHPAGPGIERKGIVSSRHEHGSVNHKRRDLEPVGILRVKHPLGAQLANIGGIDLRQTAVTAPGVVPVVRNPVCRGRFYQEVGGADVNTHVFRPRLVCPGHDAAADKPQARSKKEQKPGRQLRAFITGRLWQPSPSPACESFAPWPFPASCPRLDSRALLKYAGLLPGSWVPTGAGGLQACALPER